MEMSAIMRNIASKKDMGTEKPRVNDDALQPGGALARRLNHYRPNWPMTVIVSGVACQLC